jgi:hypothetical protein
VGVYKLVVDVLASGQPVSPREFESPLRRWASRRALRNDPERLEAVLIAAPHFASRHRDALIQGLLDASDVLDAAARPAHRARSASRARQRPPYST